MRYSLSYLRRRRHNKEEDASREMMKAIREIRRISAKRIPPEKEKEAEERLREALRKDGYDRF